MGHAVHYRDASEESQLEEVGSLQAALELVERLRNEDGASEVRVFKEVPIEVRTYYRVVALEGNDAADVAPGAPERAEGAELPTDGTDRAPSGAVLMAPPPAAPPQNAPEDTEATSEATGEQHRRPLFSRG